ncbi:MAG: thymidine kinase, partial [Phycisphaerae bacterium]
MSDGADGGRIEIITGCMFSGKTEQLIRRLTEAEQAGARVRAFKHVTDDRYDAIHLITHTQLRFPALRAANADDVERRREDANVVGIDEG